MLAFALARPTGQASAQARCDAIGPGCRRCDSLVASPLPAAATVPPWPGFAHHWHRCSCLSWAPAASQAGADLVFRGGGVYTLDADRSWAEAVAVDGGRIVYVGSDPGVASFVGSRTEIVELEGGCCFRGCRTATYIHPWA